MSFSVIITPEAEGDLRKIYRYIRKQAPQAASAWVKGARKAIKALADLPERGHAAPKTASFNEPILELLYGNAIAAHIAFFTPCWTARCFVLHVRHGSRLPLEPKQ